MFVSFTQPEYESYPFCMVGSKDNIWFAVERTNGDAVCVVQQVAGGWILTTKLDGVHNCRANYRRTKYDSAEDALRAGKRWVTRTHGGARRY